MIPNPTKRERHNHRRRSLPSLEALDLRHLLAIDVSLSAMGVLEIRSGSYDDQIVVEDATSNEGALQLRVSVTNEVAGDVSYQPASNVKSLHIESGDGDDLIDIRTALRAEANGGRGADRIYGSPEDDLLIGGPGRDRLYGRDGDDRLHGGAGIDWLFGRDGDDVLFGGEESDYLHGGWGNDEIFGGSGGDYLRGSRGNDRLMGERGLDVLEGGAGDDALIGGQGPNQLRSGNGRDRFLILRGEGDLIQDLSNLDVRIEFVNTFLPFPLLQRDGLEFALGTSWSAEEVIATDEAFQMLFDATGDNRLLELADGGELKLFRYGDVFNLEGDENVTVGGWNFTAPRFVSNVGVAIVNNAIDRDRLAEAVIHEVGHNFDEQHENSLVNSFREAGGWTRMSPSNSTLRLTIAPDPLWQGLLGRWYFPTARTIEFARSAGTNNPLEDWASAFTAKVLTSAGEDYFGEPVHVVQARMLTRFEVIDQFLSRVQF